MALLTAIVAALVAAQKECGNQVKNFPQHLSLLAVMFALCPPLLCSLWPPLHPSYLPFPVCARLASLL